MYVYSSTFTTICKITYLLTLLATPQLSMSRPTIAAGRRKGKNLPSKTAFSADTESLSASSTVTTSTTTATTTTTEGIAVADK